MKNKLIIFGGIIFAIVLFTYTCNSNTAKKERIAANNEKFLAFHCNEDWSTTRNKERLLKDVFKDPDINRNRSLHVTVASMLKKIAKYPNTLKFEGDPVASIVYLNKKYITDIDTTAGTYVYQIPFTSENKLSQTVKSELRLMMRYNAGCKPSEIIDYHIE